MARLEPKDMVTESIQLELDRNLHRIQSAQVDIDRLRDRQKLLTQELINRS